MRTKLVALSAPARRPTRARRQSVERLAREWWGRYAGSTLLARISEPRMPSPSIFPQQSSNPSNRRKFVRVGLAFSSTPEKSKCPQQQQQQRNVPVNEHIEGLPLPGDGFLLNLLRASASHVITTGKNVRLEQGLKPGLTGPHAQLLRRWRRRCVTFEPLSVYVLSRGQKPRELLSSAYFEYHSDSGSGLGSNARISIVTPHHALASMRLVAQELGLFDIGFIGYDDNCGGISDVINKTLQRKENDVHSSSSNKRVPFVGDCDGSGFGGLVVMEAGPNTANQFFESTKEQSSWPCYDHVVLTSYIPHAMSVGLNSGNASDPRDPRFQITGNDAAIDTSTHFQTETELWPRDWKSGMCVATQSREWRHAYGKWRFQLWTRILK
jgi:hypothetical protein